MQMMFGAGMLIMTLLALAVIAVPVILIIAAAGGGLAWLNNARPWTKPGAVPVSQGQQVVTVGGQRCPSCGRAVRSDWRNCPYCGASLNS